MTEKRLTLAEMRSRLAVWDDWLDAPLTHVKSGGRYVVTGFSLREEDMTVLFSYAPIGSKVAFTRPVAEIRKFARTVEPAQED